MQLKNAPLEDWGVKMEKSDVERTYEELIELMKLDEINNSQINFEEIKNMMK